MTTAPASARTDFWGRVQHYRSLGMDPLRWVAGCAVKVDLTTVVYPALQTLRPELESWSIHVNPRQDADIFPAPHDGVEVHRRLYDLKDPQPDAADLQRIRPHRAISLIQVHQRRGESPQAFADILRTVYQRIARAGVGFTVGKGHSIITPYPDTEFSLFDYLTYDSNRNDGYTLANNDTIQVIDPTDDPGSQPQTYVAAANALNDLITLGCHQHLQLLPVLDAPSDALGEQILHHLQQFTQTYGMRLRDPLFINHGKLIIGMTVLGESTREPPTRFDALTPGMEILVSRPFGDLAPINVYLSCCADADYLKELEARGFSLDDAERAKNDVIATMMQPNLRIAETISHHSPQYREPFEPDLHIAAAGDLSGPGIYIFKEIADAAQVRIELHTIPLAYPAYTEFAARNFLMDNATAGTNGAIALIAQPDVIAQVERELRQHGYPAERVGRVVGKGPSEVRIPAAAMSLIPSKALRDEFMPREKSAAP